MDLPSEDTLHFLVTKYAHMRANYGELLSALPLLEPTGEFFPDEFERTAEGVDTLLRRVASYSPLSSDLPLEVVFNEPEGESAGGGCGTGGCSTKGDIKAVARGSVLETPDGYAVVVDVRDVGDSDLLVASLSRSVAMTVLAEAEEDMTADEAPVFAEILAVAMGHGVLLTQAACVYKKGCGGMKMHQGTHLGVAEHAALLALHLRVTGTAVRAAKGHLPITQREAFEAALAWVDSNQPIVDRLREAPELLAAGAFSFEKTKGFFGRLFGKKSSDEVRITPKAKAQRSEAELRRLAEAKALVEEALAD
jgi:hypothetical protein